MATLASAMLSSDPDTPAGEEQPETGLSILYEPHDSEAEVDIIAIHGIGAHADKTWETGGVNWLKHPSMLPEASPKARIMRYAYESRWLGQDNIEQNHASITEHLLSQIRQKRSECLTRPLLFICHCFGGILIQRAVITARLHSDQYLVVKSTETQKARDIVDCIAGIIFLGTPFRGSHAQTYAKIVGNLLAHFNRGNSSIYELTEARDREQRNQLNDFVWVVNHQSIPICCFYEQHKAELAHVVFKIAPPIPMNEIVVDEASATIDGIRSIPLAAHHFNMNKYSCPDDSNYRTVLPELTEMIGEAQARVEARLYPRYRRESAKDIKLESKSKSLKLLHVEEPHKEKVALQQQIKEKSMKTNDLVFSHGAFTTWRNSKKEGLLWIYGEDGYGKTPLAMALIGSMKNRVERSSERRAMAYCFCSNRVGPQKCGNAIVRSMLYQILLRQPEEDPKAFDVWLDAHEQNKETIFKPGRFIDLWKVLLQTIEAAGIKVAYFLLYRPEEADPGFMEGFPELRMISQSDNYSIKWIIISRLPPGGFGDIRPNQEIDLASIPDGTGAGEYSSFVSDSLLSESSSSVSLQSEGSSEEVESAPEGATEVSSMEQNGLLPPLNTEKLATVVCDKVTGFWQCNLEISVAGPVSITATRTDRQGLMIMKDPHDDDMIEELLPHTTSDRKCEVTFLHDLAVTVKSNQALANVRDKPRFLFQDEASFLAFQEDVFRSKLAFLRKVTCITSDQGAESSGQDLRVWSFRARERLLTFFSDEGNQENGTGGAYIKAPSSAFLPIDTSDVTNDSLVLELEIRKQDTEPPAATGNGNGARGGKEYQPQILNSKGQALQSLSIEFRSHVDRSDFLAVWQNVGSKGHSGRVD